MTWLSALLLVAATGAQRFPEQHAPGEVIVQLTPDCREHLNPAVNGVVATMGIPEIDELNTRLGIKRIMKIVRDPKPNQLAQQYGLDLLYTMIADPAVDVYELVDAYLTCPRIAGAWPNIIRPVDEVPNDPRYSSQWHLAKIGAPAAWDISHGDPGVVFGVVDQGVDYTHEDIGANVWINDFEDINHNGRFDPIPESQGGDLNDIDDDGNGYTDDVCGYDFLSYDPDPMPEGNDDHGQHCFGDAGAVTNNGLGVASPGWGCRGMCLRAGAGGGIYMGPAIAAIYYTVEKGAWISSHSYGSSSPYPPERSAMEYAYASGALVCAAAGNDGVTSPHYPGSYDVCIAVAASDQADRRCSWSNYGSWIEVAAPGTGIVSTVLHNGYTALDGTSMATPVTAGLLCLIKAANPGLTNEQARETLFATCETMPDPDFRAGLLGHGRISAVKAIARPRRCYLTMTGMHLNDPNHNGIPEPGEACALTVTLGNEANWQPATGVTATLVCTDPDVTITKAGATFPDIPPGGSGSCAADSFLFEISGNAVPHNVTFRLDKSSTPANLAPSDFPILRVGMPRFLLVDDYATDAVARWYRWTCDSLRVLYDQYSVAASGPPSVDTLRHYPVVIWFTGLDSTNCMSSECQNALAGYLDNHGKLVISGQNLGQHISGSSFYANYLHATLDTGNTGKIFTLGLVGDPIGNGDTIVCGGAGGANNARSCDGVRPISGARGCVIYKDYPDTTVYGAIRYHGGYDVVYFAEPFEAIDHATARYVQRWTLLRRILVEFDEPLPPVAVAEPELTPETWARVSFVRPAPVQREARISYVLTARRDVVARIFDSQGRLVKTLAAERQGPGRHELTWSLMDLGHEPVANGIYFCALTAGPDSRSGKLLVAR
ncbi:MAG: S8 family serine peptidase [candidate division WOR-3 bacterium]